MNIAALTALIVAITGCIGVITTLITLLIHIRNHTPIPPDNPVNSPVKSGTTTPVDRGPTL